MTIARIWAKHGLKAHRLEGYLSSNDPDFETKAADITGLYLKPTQHAAVFFVNETTVIKRCIATIPCSRCRLVAPSAMALSTTATARCLCEPRSTRNPVKCWARPRRATPRPSSSPF